MKKGGVRATVAHNEAARAAGGHSVAPDPSPSPEQPLTAAPRTDGRASDRSAAGRTDRMPVVAVVAAAGVGSLVTHAAWVIASVLR